MIDLQNMLEVKNVSLVLFNNDLQVVEEQYQRFVVKVEDMQKSMFSKDNIVYDLWQQMIVLQSQFQQVQLEWVMLISKLKVFQVEILFLQSVWQWYQQQFVLVQEVCVRLQGEMVYIQVGQMIQVGFLEYLKFENVFLFQQLMEIQYRFMKEKGWIVVQLQGIEVDMLDQEVVFLQIQEVKIMVEEDFQRRLEEFEGEREWLQRMVDLVVFLEQQLEQVKLILFQ